MFYYPIKNTVIKSVHRKLQTTNPDTLVIWLFVFIRIASVGLVRTYFVPDEYLQSLEVAHELVFGYGCLTWEWEFGIRSYIYPLLIAVFYKILQLFSLDAALLVIYVPRVMQALLTAYADFCLYKWSGTKKWAVLNIASSWFLFYTGSRTLINSFESALSTIALYYFPWPGKGREDNVTFIFIIALVCVVRATAAIVWLPICVYHLFITKQSIFQLIFEKYVPIGILVLFASIALDSCAHGSFIVTQYQFLKYNVFKEMGSSYGIQPWHWYLWAGFPAILGIQIVPFIIAAFVIIKHRNIYQNELVLLGTIVFTILVYSFVPHKEFRFLLPLLPIVLYITSKFCAIWSRKAKTRLLWASAGIILIGNLVPAWYLGWVHQGGTLEVMKHLREIANSEGDTTFVFLMPCHSTPLYSHLHVFVHVRFLRCEPNLFNEPHFEDETDDFYRFGPEMHSIMSLRNNEIVPSHLIVFDALIPSDYFQGYERILEIFHTDFPLTSRIGNYVHVYRWIGFYE